MTTTSTIGEPGLAAARDLRTTMRGKAVLPGDDAYARARQIWNGALDYYPALFALCETPEDVQAAVCIARLKVAPTGSALTACP
jgi:hypothetical protein